MAAQSPRQILETRLRRAIMASLHELVPEFRSHVGSCASCHDFHDWLVWRHREGTSEWYAECPTTGAQLVLPFRLAGRGNTEGPSITDSTTL